MLKFQQSLEYSIFLIYVIFNYISLTEAFCPAGVSVKVYGHSGVIKAKTGYNRNDKCEWKIFAPKGKRNHKIIINITRITCDKNLIVHGEDFCQHKPRITRIYIPNSCKEDCKLSTCRKTKGYPITVTYGRYADDNGFVIRYGYEPCGAGSQVVMPRRPTSSPPRTTAMDYISVTSQEMQWLNITTSASQELDKTTQQENITEVTNLSQELRDSQVPIVVIVVPIVTAIAISILLIAVAMKVRRMKREEGGKKNHEESNGTMQSYIPTPSVSGTVLYETLSKKKTTQCFTNEAYQSLPMDGGSYAKNKYDTVFQQPLDENKPSNSQQPSSHIYEHIKSEAGVAESSKIEHQYDEVASECDSFEDCSSDDETVS